MYVEAFLCFADWSRQPSFESRISMENVFDLISLFGTWNDGILTIILKEKKKTQTNHLLNTFVKPQLYDGLNLVFSRRVKCVSVSS